MLTTAYTSKAPGYRLPNSVRLRGLGLIAGDAHILRVTTSDGVTPTVKDEETFLYQGEDFLHFNEVAICHAGQTIMVSLNALQSHLNHGDLDQPCE